MFFALRITAECIPTAGLVSLGCAYARAFLAPTATKPLFWQATASERNPRVNSASLFSPLLPARAGDVHCRCCGKTNLYDPRAACAEAARVLAHGGWLVVVSHVDPATDEGASLLSEVLVPAMQESTPAGKGNGKNEAFSWSIDVHCSSEDDDEGESGSCCDEGEEHGGFDEGCAAGGEDATSGRGPSVYMARKVFYFCWLVRTSTRCTALKYARPSKRRHVKAKIGNSTLACFYGDNPFDMRFRIW